MDNKGFTLIELMVTVALLLAIVSIAIPNINNMSNRNKNKQKERIIQSIIDAKNTYCEFNDCTTDISIQTLINEKLLDEDSISEVIDISQCMIKKDDTTLNDLCIK